MKKIIGLLFALQLIVGMFYGLFYLRNENYYGLVWENNTIITLGFEEGDIEAYDFLLTLIDEKELVVSRVVFTNSETTTIYTSDMTLNGRVTLIEGTFPTIGTSEFVSTQETEELSQVGLIADIVPGHHIVIGDIQNPQNFGLDGLYYINTTDSELLDSLARQLREELRYVQVLGGTTSPFRFLRVFFSLMQEGVSVWLHLTELIAIFPVIILCILTSLIQYALNKLKSSAVFLTHGYAIKKILKQLSWELIKVLILVSFFVYLGALIYLVLTNRLVFISSLTVLLLLLASGSIIFYLMTVNLITLFALRSFKIIAALKGHKVNLRIQLFNHLSKGIFTGVLLFLIGLTLTNLIRVNEQRYAFSYWEKAENIYRIIVSGGPMDSQGLWGYNSQKVAFYHDLITYHNGFMMDSGVVLMMDGWAYDDWGPPSGELHLLNRIDNIEISPSFLNINPIYTVDSELAYDQLILEDGVFNILFPEHLMVDKEEIYGVLLSTFYEAEQLNIIYVQDNQYYFSFDRHLRPQAGNRVRDPLAIIFSGSAASEVMTASAITHSVYFQATTNNAFAEIEPLIQYHGLQSQIQRLEAVYDDNIRDIRALQEHQIRLITLLALLIIANISVAYNLVANYFERYKFDIFLKSTLGWSVFKQNKAFLITYFAYSLPLLLMMSFTLGWHLLLIGLMILTLDIVAMFLFQRHLMKKSFSEIMKGER